MSTPPRKSERKRTAASDAAPRIDNDNDDATPSALGKTPKLSERLPGMSDFQLRAYQGSAGRISREPTHPKYGAAVRAVPQIEEEIRRRANLLAEPGAK